MRCPKCQYISFDSGDRCRNCGYELSLSADEPQIDVEIGRDEPRAGRIDETSWSAFDAPLSSNRSAGELDRDTDVVTADDAFAVVSPDDLPLFTDRLGIADDQAPLVTPPAVPRQPLSVRRANPVARPRSRGPLPQEPSFNLEEGGKEILVGHRGNAPTRDQSAASTNATAGIIRRVGAGLIDALILCAIETAVFYLTLRACELTPNQWQLMPLLPLGAFMLLLCGGYFVLFTAAVGQTVGKMATRIRVIAVAADGNGSLRVSFGTALLRAIACLGSVVLVGVGFLPIIFSADRRAFHDRVAETRVINA